MGAADASVFGRQSVIAGGHTVTYLRGGRGRPLVYLHGLGGAGKWESYHMAFANDALTLAPQLPGWQDWQPPADLDSVAAYAKFVVRFLDAIEVDRVILVGHSIGGWIAQHLAVEHPRRVDRLLLVDSLGVDIPDAPAVDLASMDEEAFATGLLAKLGLIASAQPYGFGAEFTNVRSSPEFERQWKGRELLAKLVKGRSADPELSGRLGEITAETLIIWGERDGLAPLAQAHRLHGSIPSSRLAVIEAAGHLPMVEKRETFHRLCRDFLTGVDERLPGVLTPARP